jgi:hypothetical protein
MCDLRNIKDWIAAAGNRFFILECNSGMWLELLWYYEATVTQKQKMDQKYINEMSNETVLGSVE